MQVDENDPIMRVEKIELHASSTVVSFELLDEGGIYMPFDVHVQESARPNNIGPILRQAHAQLRDRLRRITSEANEVCQGHG